MRNIVKKLQEKLKDQFSNSRTVDFIICGTQKGGTSALDEYLREHPEICMAEKKEIHFFDDEKMFLNDSPDYAKYHSFFKPNKNHKVLGEATPIYIYWEAAPRRIWEYNPNIKLIVLLRNPVERAYSHWNMQRSKKLDHLSFWDAINSEKERSNRTSPYQDKRYSYIDRGFYVEQLQRLWYFFPNENVFIVKSEELKENPAQVLNNVCRFLGISNFNKIISKNVHSRRYLSNMSNKERSYLNSIFEPEIKKLEAELNWDCSSWLEDTSKNTRE